MKILMVLMSLLLLSGCGRQFHHLEKVEIIEAVHTEDVIYLKYKIESGSVYTGTNSAGQALFVGSKGYRECYWKNGHRSCWSTVYKSHWRDLPDYETALMLYRESQKD